MRVAPRLARDVVAIAQEPRSESGTIAWSIHRQLLSFALRVCSSTRKRAIFSIIGSGSGLRVFHGSPFIGGDSAIARQSSRRASPTVRSSHCCPSCSAYGNARARAASRRPVRQSAKTPYLRFAMLPPLGIAVGVVSQLATCAVAPPRVSRACAFLPPRGRHRRCYARAAGAMRMAARCPATAKGFSRKARPAGRRVPPLTEDDATMTIDPVLTWSFLGIGLFGQAVAVALVMRPLRLLCAGARHKARLPATTSRWSRAGAVLPADTSFRRFRSRPPRANGSRSNLDGRGCVASRLQPNVTTRTTLSR